MTNKIINAIKSAHEEYQALKGGAGSGNWGHAGIPGKRGGSLAGSGGTKGGSTIKANSELLKKSPNNYGVIEGLGVSFADIKPGRGGSSDAKFKGNAVNDIRKALQDNGYKEQKLGPGNTFVRPSGGPGGGKRVDFDHNNGETWISVMDYLG